MTYLDKDKMEMIFEVILEHIFGGRVRARVSQKQSVVEWGGEAILLLHPEIVFFVLIKILKTESLHFISNIKVNILQKVGRLVSQVSFSIPIGQQRWSYFKKKHSVLFEQQSAGSSWNFSLQSWPSCAKSRGWTMERCVDIKVTTLPSSQLSDYIELSDFIKLSQPGSFSHVYFKAHTSNYGCSQYYHMNTRKKHTKVTVVNRHFTSLQNPAPILNIILTLWMV